MTEYQTDLTPKEAIDEIRSQRQRKLVLVIAGGIAGLVGLFGVTTLMFNDDMGDAPEPPATWRY